jgi:hypothetical protein
MIINISIQVYADNDGVRICHSLATVDHIECYARLEPAVSISTLSTDILSALCACICNDLVINLFFQLSTNINFQRHLESDVLLLDE